MMQFFYDSYNYIKDTDMALHVKVYGIADKYDIPVFRYTAATRLSSDLDPTNKDLEPFFRAVRAIDECTVDTDNLLWDVVIPKITGNITHFKDKDDFFALLQKLPVLNQKLLKAWPSPSDSDLGYRLPWLGRGGRGGRGGYGPSDW